jgi:hypothetical protein
MSDHKNHFAAFSFLNIFTYNFQYSFHIKEDKDKEDKEDKKIKIRIRK